jgi:hypothetical protein
MFLSNSIMKKIQYLLFTVLVYLSAGCDQYLDVVPDNVATIDNAFTMRNNAEKYLFTCYRYMPGHGNITNNPAFTAGDEFWFYNPFIGFTAPGWNIARGNQNVVEPFLNYWDGVSQLFIGIRDCNIFMENIDKVRDMEDEEKARWIGEVKFLKAYYHFWLLRMYGPIPIVKENIPISADVEEVKVKRAPADECVKYIVELLDEAAASLPDEILNELTELGRATRPMALSVKALVLVTAASPLFNGNTEYAGFKDKDGRQLINPTFDPTKWQAAATSCREAIEACHAAGKKLYTFSQGISQFKLSPQTVTQMSIRNSVCERWNSEIIWGNTNSRSLTAQHNATPPGLDPTNVANGNTLGNLAPPIKIAEMFYSKNGVPINEDNTYNYNGRFSLRTAVAAEKYTIQTGYTTAVLHFDREARFYASLAFDGGLWYGQGRLDDNNQWLIQNKMGQLQSRVSVNRYSITGYWPKKLVSYENVIGTGNTYTVQQYPWPVIRLTDLYLMYSEALNEAEGPSAEAFKWIDLVRERAGLPGVEQAWTQFSKQPNKFSTKDGFRDIIQQERLIELAFEGHRFWDLRRWKRAHTELNKPVTGWDIDQKEAAGYYRERMLYNQTFLMRDYLWPIKDENLIINKNLVQNPGW